MVSKFIFLCSSEWFTVRCGVCLTCQSGVMSSYPKIFLNKSLREKLKFWWIWLSVLSNSTSSVWMDGCGVSEVMCSCSSEVHHRLTFPGLLLSFKNTLWNWLIILFCSFMRMFYVWKQWWALCLRAALVYLENDLWYSGSCGKIPKWFICFGFCVSLKATQTSCRHISSVCCSGPPPFTHPALHAFIFLLQTTLQTDEVKNVPCGTR